MAGVHKRKATEELPRTTKRMKHCCPELPVEIWSAIEEEVISVTTRSAMRLVCKQFGELFDDRDQWAKLVGYEESDTDSKCLTYQLVTYCRIDGPHTLQYHVVFRLAGLVHCFELGHQQLLYLYGKVGGKYKLPKFPETTTVKAVGKWMKKTEFLLDGHWPTSMSAKMYEDRAYVYAMHGDIFLFLEFGLHCSSVKSYQWPVHNFGQECVYNRPFSSESEFNESTVGIDEMKGLWSLGTASSLYFFNPSTRQCWGHRYLEEEGGYDEIKLLRADDVEPKIEEPDLHPKGDEDSDDDSASTFGDPYADYNLDSDSEDSHEPLKRTLVECILVYDGGKIREEHPYPKPSTFIVTEERLLNK